MPPTLARRTPGWRRSQRSTLTASSISVSPSAPRWPSVWRWSGRLPHSSCAPRSRRWPKSASVHYPWLPVGWLLIDRYPSIDRIGSLSAPVLVIAGDRDDIVPESLSRRLYEAAPDPKRYLLVPGTGHNDPELIVVAACSTRSGGSCRRRVCGSDTGRVKPAICEQFGIDFPLFAFSHCRDVVAAVTNAGGFGVLGGDGVHAGTARPGAVMDRRPCRRQALRRRHDRARKIRGQRREPVPRSDLAARIPESCRGFITDLLADHDIEPEPKPFIGGSSLAGNTGRNCSRWR